MTKKATTEGNTVPIGSLESPSKTGPDAHIVKVPSQSGVVVELARHLLNYAACLFFLPITITGRIIEALLLLKNRLSIRHPSLEGKVVLITGASSGLGEALARCFYREGCRLIIASRRQQELERVRNQLMGSSCRVSNDIYPPVVVQLDLENAKALKDKIKTIVGIYGHVDILVNNAGMSYRGEAFSTDIDVDVKLMNVNYFGTIALTKAILPSMIERKSGHVVMVGSLQAKMAIPFRSAYGASKHALQAFSDSLRAEIKSEGVLVTVANPGYIRTSLSLNAVTSTGEKYGQMDETTESGWDPADVAEEIVKAVKEKKKEVMICSLFYRLAVYLRILLPTAFFAIMERRAAKTAKVKVQ